MVIAKLKYRDADAPRALTIDPTSHTKHNDHVSDARRRA